MRDRAPRLPVDPAGSRDIRAIGPALRAEGQQMQGYGIVVMVLGSLAMLAPVLTSVSVALLVGVFVLVAGFLRVFWASQAMSSEHGLLALAVGGLTAICGAAVLANPLFSIGDLNLVLMIYLVVDGALETVAGFQRQPLPGRGTLMFGGMLSLVLGVAIWLQAPLAGSWAIGVLLGFKLLSIGAIMTRVGPRSRSCAIVG